MVHTILSKEKVVQSDSANTCSINKPNKNARIQLTPTINQLCQKIVNLNPFVDLNISANSNVCPIEALGKQKARAG